MNPLALMSYLDAQNKARQRQTEQQNAFAQQLMQQQLGVAQTGMELRDRQFAREQQIEQNRIARDAAAKQGELTQLQIDEARRAANERPGKEKLQFFSPLAEPYAAYVAANEALKAYQDPKNKVRLPGRERTLINNIRDARTKALAVRDVLMKNAEIAGLGYNVDDANRIYNIEPLPIFGQPNTGVTKAEGLPADNVSAPVSALAPAPVASSAPASMPTLGISPSALQSPFTSSLAGFMASPGAAGFSQPMALGAVKPPVKPVAKPPIPAGKPAVPSAPVRPPVVIPSWADTTKALNDRLSALRQAEGGFSYGDLDEPDQKLADTTADAMVQDVLDSFTPQSWNAKATGREHSVKSAEDLFSFATSEDMLKRLFARYATGDAAAMKNVILERFASRFNQFGLPPKVVERLMKGAKDSLDVVESETKIEGLRQGQKFAKAGEERAAAKHRLDMQSGELEYDTAKKTQKTRIDMLKQQAANAATEGKIADEQLLKLQREAKAGKTVNWLSMFGSAEGLYDKVVATPIDKAITSIEEQLKMQMRGLVQTEQAPAREAIKQTLQKLSRVRTRLAAGSPTNYRSAISSNQANVYDILSDHKKELLAEVVQDPQLKPFFLDIFSTSAPAGGMPGAKN